MQWPRTFFASGIIPAYAGSTRISRGPCGASRDHPRIRGEHGQAHVQPRRALGSSPHTRGAPKLTVWTGKRWRIIPAYAGSTCTSRPPGAPRWDHPRIRGEHATRAHETRRPGRIIPAYAGSTGAIMWGRQQTLDHPRIRGEHAALASQAHSIAGSSPHTRGALSRRAGRGCRCRIIPAYAGSTDFLGDALAPVGDHPRIRGEHAVDPCC